MKEKFIEMFGNFVDFQEIEGVYWEIREHLNYVIKDKYKLVRTKDVLGYKYTIYIDNIRKDSVK